MLKRYLIAIAIVGLGMVSSAFAQDGVRGKRPSKTNPEIKRSDAIVKPTTAEVNEITIDGTKVYGNEVEIKDGRRGNSSETSRTSGRNSSTQSKKSAKAPAEFQDGADIILRRSAKSKGASTSRKTVQKTIRKPQRKPFYEDMMEGTGIRRKQPRKRN